MPAKILVLFYSFTGHTAQLAQEIAAGSQQVSGVEVVIKQVPESLPEHFFDDKPEITAARQSFADIPVATLEDFTSADGVAVGTPVHFGSFSSQLKAFIDQLSPVYLQSTMVDKPVAFFTSAGSVHGGEEAALLTMMIPFLNLGMLPLGVPYPIQGEDINFDAGSPYGAIYVSGHKGDRPLEEADKKVAHLLGRRLATMTKVIAEGLHQKPAETPQG